MSIAVYCTHPQINILQAAHTKTNFNFHIGRKTFNEFNSTATVIFSNWLAHVYVLCVCAGLYEYTVCACVMYSDCFRWWFLLLFFSGYGVQCQLFHRIVTFFVIWIQYSTHLPLTHSPFRQKYQERHTELIWTSESISSIFSPALHTFRCGTVAAMLPLSQPLAIHVCIYVCALAKHQKHNGRVAQYCRLYTVVNAHYMEVCARVYVCVGVCVYNVHWSSTSSALYRMNAIQLNRLVLFW